MGESNGEVVVRDVSKHFGSTRALDGIQLTVKGGEFFTLLGPSGSGKSTLLRAIGGFSAIDGGSVLIDGQDVTHVLPAKRPTAMVFQSYALFPHLSVFENVAFGLRVRRLPRTEIDTRVRDALKLVKMDSFMERNAAELSGGQQQRVALARAVVVQPKILLLDEPLSALDAQLREEMQRELRALQCELGITAISVTHDQNEALGMSDRVAVMRNGKIEQVGTPEMLYAEPASEYVATFIGKAALVGVVRSTASALFIRGLDLALNPTRVKVIHRTVGPAAVLRPEMLRLMNATQRHAGQQTMLFGRVIATRFIGSSFLLEVALDDGIVATVDVASTTERIAINAPIALEVKKEYLA